MPPHLDLVLTSPDGILAIESKCTEFLGSHKAKFADEYAEKITNHRSKTGWFLEMMSLRQQPAKYHFLDAAQLIKHYFGLAQTYPVSPIILVYLYWEPANADKFDDFKQHRAEIEKFSKAVADSEISFKALSYPELWETWADFDQPDWLARHLTNLRSRYLVSLK